MISKTNDRLIWEKTISDGINTGDTRTFNEVIDKLSPVLKRYIFSIVKNESDAEEITQEVFVKLWENRRSYKPKTLLVTYLYRLAYNASIDFFRKNKQHRRTYQLEHVRPENIKDPPPEIQEKKIADDILKKNLEILTKKQKHALLLRVYEEKSYEEIANILRVSVPSVESLLFRARQKLKRKLSADDG